jgi:hypothetical protein
MHAGSPDPTAGEIGAFLLGHFNTNQRVDDACEVDEKHDNHIELVESREDAAGVYGRRL